MDDIFSETYELKYSYAYSIREEVEKPEPYTIGSREEKKCIYCGRTPNEITFKKEAHVIPAAMGNKYIFNFNECDECNTIFGDQHENDLMNYFSIERVFVGAPKRKGYPKFKPITGGQTEMTRIPGSNTVRINIDGTEERLKIEVDEENHKITYTAINPPAYSPTGICKAIAHMGWAFMDNLQREKVSFLSEWMLNKIEIYPFYWDVARISSGNGFSNVIFELWEDTDENSEYPFLFRLYFGLQVLSMYVPKTSQTNSVPKRFGYYNLIPKEIDLNISAQIIKEEGKLIPKDVTYTMSFESMEK